MNQQKQIAIDRTKKAAEITPVYNIDGLQKRWQKMIKLLRNVDSNAQTIGDMKIGDKMCTEFLVQSEFGKVFVSIEKTTRLPVQIKAPAEDGDPYETLVEQFVFDQPLDLSLFSLEPPEGFKLTVIEGKQATDDSFLELSPGSHLGDAKFGMTLEQVVAALGQPDKISDVASTTFAKDSNQKLYSIRELNYSSRGFLLLVDEKHGLIKVTCMGMTYGNRVFQGKMAGGIRMGASPDEVKSVLGEPTRKPVRNWGETESDLIFELPDDSSISFTFDNNKLIMVKTDVQPRD